MRKKAWVDGAKHCSKCDRWLPPSSFHKNARNWDKLHAYCKDCMATAASLRYKREAPRLLEQGKQYRLANKEKRRSAQMVSRFNLSLSEYQSILKAQSNICAICKRPPKRKRLHIDHDHTTGAIRGLLCFNCNMAIGYLADNPDAARAAAEYLTSHKARSVAA